MKIIGSGIIIENKRILLIKRSYTKKDNPNVWAFPGGTHELNETSEETTIREVKEEVGLDFTPQILFLENIFQGKHFFRYIGEGKGTIILQEEECDGYGWFTYEETIKLPISGNMLELVNKLKEENYI